MERLLTIDDLLPDPRNPRRISEPALQGLQASLRAFGDVALCWNRRTGEMVSGHQRIAALKAEAKRRGGELLILPRGDDRADIVLQAGDGMAEEHFALRIVDWPRAEQTAAALAANNQAIAGDWTADVEALLAEVEAGMPELFEELRLGEILAEMETETESGDDSGAGSDEIPEKWDVLAECGSESEQTKALELLMAEGFKCRALIS